ncbi:MAG TPA: Fic family protein [Melioribacteraceae bacterium]|nr:Fic family protein [Melioribacteraceae bacterium]
MKKNEEISYLAELISDFPTSNSISPQEAFNKIFNRYHALSFRNLDFLMQDIIENIKNKLNKAKNKKEVIRVKFPTIFYYLIQVIHAILFYDILSNAGKFRNKNDKNNGFVGFGGNKNGKLKFNGVDPDKIDECVINACSHLKEKTTFPVENSMRFYQNFVYAHPFYDANGRIGRLIVTLYLSKFNLVINWEKVESNKKFMKRLNECHKRAEKPEEFEKYFALLINYINKFIIKLN